MQITDVRVRKPAGPESNLKAYCSVVLDGMFVVHDIRVVKGVNGLFVSMPSRKTTEGEYKDLAHPITHEARELLQRAVLDAYLRTERAETVSA